MTDIKNPDKKELSLEENNSLVLEYLNKKNPGEWTKEEKIEQDLAEKIHYYHARLSIQDLLQRGYIEYTRLGCSYKISLTGKELVIAQKV